jgi:hypothetical protein
LSGRSPREAVDASIHRLQTSLSCVTKAVLRPSTGGYRDCTKVHALLLNDGRPVPLRAATGVPRIRLGVKIQYRIVEDPGPLSPWKVRTAAYQYAIETEDGQEVLVYHWHPAANSPITFPHVHLGSIALKGDGVLDHKDHLPTGRVALQQVIRLAVADFRAKPLRRDWTDVLAQAEAAFRLDRSW